MPEYHPCGQFLGLVRGSRRDVCQAQLASNWSLVSTPAQKLEKRGRDSGLEHGVDGRFFSTERILRITMHDA